MDLTAYRQWLGRGGTRIVVAALVAVIAISVIATYRAMGDFLSANQQAGRSRGIVLLLNQTRGLVVDAETAVRGYVITGEPEYLEPYAAAGTGLEPLLATIDKLSGDPARKARLGRLREAVSAKIAGLEQIRTLRDTQGVDAATRAISDGEGRRLMDAVRAQVDALLVEEETLSRELESRTAHELALAKRLFALLAVLAVGLLALAIALAERDVRHAERNLESASSAHRGSLAALSEHDEQARIVHNTIIDAIITIDERGILQTVNAAGERLFGYSAQEMIGRNVNMLMPPPYRDEHDGYIANYLATGTAKIIGIGREVSARRKDGTVFPIDLAVSEARVEGRRLFTGVVRDLTDRKAIQAEVRELQRTLQERGRMADIGAVTAQIVHDLGNPIAALSMHVQRLARLARRGDERLTELAIGITAQIGGSIRRLDALLEELRDFSRQQRLELTQVDLKQLLTVTRDIWQPVAAARGVEVRVDLNTAAPPIVADESKLFRVLDNLVKNAIEAIEESPGSVCLSVSSGASPRHGVRISVSDSGPGIPESLDVFRLFETTKANGSGLGLPIARRIIEAHGGGLSFARLSPHGTVFHIDLPAGPHQGQAASDPASRR
jgi:two-component system sensor kinase FixL